jgi:hypothetical protein
MLLHSQQNLSDQMHGQMTAALSADCNAIGRSLANRARGLAGRLMPNGSVALNPVIEALGLDRPCEAAAGDLLLRYGALYDLMTAVFSLEAYAAGASFDAPFDRDVAYALSPPLTEELDEWVTKNLPSLAAPLRGTARRFVTPTPTRRKEPAVVACRSFADPWNRLYCEFVSGRGYPSKLELTGWHSLDDYIEEDERRRKIDLTTPDSEAGFTVRALFGLSSSVRELVAPDGQPSPLSEQLSWSRVESDVGSAYRIGYVRAGETIVYLEVPIPRHPGLPGRRTVEAARSFAALALRWGHPVTLRR